MAEQLIKLANDETETVVGVLALTDATFWPHRHKRFNDGVAIDQARRNYFKRGINFTIGGGNRERQAGWKLLSTLQSKGVLKVYRGEGTRRRVALTEVGEHWTRALCGLPLCHDSIHLTSTLLDAFIEHSGNGPFVHESKFKFDLPQLAPLSMRGWIVSASCSRGMLGYAHGQMIGRAITPGSTLHIDGYVVADSPLLPKRSAAAAGLYAQQLDASLVARESWQPDPANEVHIPLSCGLWPGSAIDGDDDDDSEGE